MPTSGQPLSGGAGESVFTLIAPRSLAQWMTRIRDHARAPSCGPNASATAQVKGTHRNAHRCDLTVIITKTLLTLPAEPLKHQFSGRSEVLQKGCMRLGRVE
ncbi:MAG: hypothetical protein ACI9OJ_002761 [Myxococcota bacterium]|jgi:hypothetical protein